MGFWGSGAFGWARTWRHDPGDNYWCNPGTNFHGKH